MNLDVRGVTYEPDDELREHIGRRVTYALGRFAGRVGGVTVRLFDDNGPRGGRDKRCRITVALLPRGVVRAESVGDDPFALVGLAAKRARIAVGRRLERRRRVHA